MLPSLALALVLAAPVAPRVVESRVPADDSIPVRQERDIRLTALRHARDVRRCYEDEGLRRNPDLDGVVEVELTILPTGVVDSVKVSSATVIGAGAAEASRCIATIARQWRFERGPYDTETIVFPFVLRRDEPKVEARAGG